MAIKLSEQAIDRIKELEAKRKKLADDIEAIKKVDCVKVAETDRKRLNKLYEDYVNATMVEIPVNVTVMLDDDGTINDICDQIIGDLVDNKLVKKSDISKLKKLAKQMEQEAARLAKKYNTDTDTIKEICC